MYSKFVRFKNKLTTPLRTDILKACLRGPSLQYLPPELLYKITAMLQPLDRQHLAACSKQLYIIYLDLLYIERKR